MFDYQRVPAMRKPCCYKWVSHLHLAACITQWNQNLSSHVKPISDTMCYPHMPWYLHYIFTIPYHSTSTTGDKCSSTLKYLHDIHVRSPLHLSQMVFDSILNHIPTSPLWRPSKISLPSYVLLIKPHCLRIMVADFVYSSKIPQTRIIPH